MTTYIHPHTRNNNICDSLLPYRKTKQSNSPKLNMFDKINLYDYIISLSHPILDKSFIKQYFVDANHIEKESYEHYELVYNQQINDIKISVNFNQYIDRVFIHIKYGFVEYTQYQIGTTIHQNFILRKQQHNFDV